MIDIHYFQKLIIVYFLSDSKSKLVTMHFASLLVGIVCLSSVSTQDVSFIESDFDSATTEDMEEMEFRGSPQETTTETTTPSQTTLSDVFSVTTEPSLHLSSFSASSSEPLMTTKAAEPSTTIINSTLLSTTTLSPVSYELDTTEEIATGVVAVEEAETGVSEDVSAFAQLYSTLPPTTIQPPVSRELTTEEITTDAVTADEDETKVAEDLPLGTVPSNTEIMAGSSASDSTTESMRIETSTFWAVVGSAETTTQRDTTTGDDTTDARKTEVNIIPPTTQTVMGDDGVVATEDGWLSTTERPSLPGNSSSTLRSATVTSDPAAVESTVFWTTSDTTETTGHGKTTTEDNVAVTRRTEVTTVLSTIKVTTENDGVVTTEDSLPTTTTLSPPGTSTSNLDSTLLSSEPVTTASASFWTTLDSTGTTTLQSTAAEENIIATQRTIEVTTIFSTSHHPELTTEYQTIAESYKTVNTEETFTSATDQHQSIPEFSNTESTVDNVAEPVPRESTAFWTTYDSTDATVQLKTTAEDVLAFTWTTTLDSTDTTITASEQKTTAGDDIIATKATTEVNTIIPTFQTTTENDKAVSTEENLPLATNQLRIRRNSSDTESFVDNAAEPMPSESTAFSTTIGSTDTTIQLKTTAEDIVTSTWATTEVTTILSTSHNPEVNIDYQTTTEDGMTVTTEDSLASATVQHQRILESSTVESTVYSETVTSQQITEENIVTATTAEFIYKTSPESLSSTIDDGKSVTTEMTTNLSASDRHDVISQQETSTERKETVAETFKPASQQAMQEFDDWQTLLESTTLTTHESTTVQQAVGSRLPEFVASQEMIVESQPVESIMQLEHLIDYRPIDRRPIDYHASMGSMSKPTVDDLSIEGSGYLPIESETMDISPGGQSTEKNSDFSNLVSNEDSEAKSAAAQSFEQHATPTKMVGQHLEQHATPTEMVGQHSESLQNNRNLPVIMANGASNSIIVQINLQTMPHPTNNSDYVNLFSAVGNLMGNAVQNETSFNDVFKTQAKLCPVTADSPLLAYLLCPKMAKDASLFQSYPTTNTPTSVRNDGQNERKENVTQTTDNLELLDDHANTEIPTTSTSSFPLVNAQSNIHRLATAEKHFSGDVESVVGVTKANQSVIENTTVGAYHATTENSRPRGSNSVSESAASHVKNPTTAGSWFHWFLSGQDGVSGAAQVTTETTVQRKNREQSFSESDAEVATDAKHTGWINWFSKESWSGIGDRSAISQNHSPVATSSVSSSSNEYAESKLTTSQSINSIINDVAAEVGNTLTESTATQSTTAFTAPSFIDSDKWLSIEQFIAGTNNDIKDAGALSDLYMTGENNAEHGSKPQSSEPVMTNTRPHWLFSSTRSAATTTTTTNRPFPAMGKTSKNSYLPDFADKIKPPPVALTGSLRDALHFLNAKSNVELPPVGSFSFRHLKLSSV